MQPITVPAPQFQLDPPGSPPVLEKPLHVRVAAIRYPDGRELAQEDAQRIGAYVYRAAGGGEQVWHDGEQRWVAPPDDIGLLAVMPPLPLQFKAGDAMPWQGVLVAAGQKDRTGTARFAKAVSGSPRYRVRAFALARRDGVDYRGLGAASLDLEFASLADTQRFAVDLDTDDAQTCRRVRLMLKDAGLSEAGYVEIRAAAGQEVEIANCAPGGAVRARIVLEESGDIRLEPASGRRIVLGGMLEAELIRYQPQGGGAKETL
jgi:hypothetical protein